MESWQIWLVALCAVTIIGGLFAFARRSASESPAVTGGSTGEPPAPAV